MGLAAVSYPDMTPTTEQLRDVVKALADHVLLMDKYVLALAEARESQNQFIAARMPGLSEKERAHLKSVYARSESSSEHLEAAMKKWRETFESCPIWK